MLNFIVIMGRLTRDPELRYTQSQTPVASFTVAVDRDYTGRNGGEKQTDFINCVAWRTGAEFVSKYFRKGSMIVVTGSLQMRSYEDRDGCKRIAAEIVAENTYFGEIKRDSGNSSNGAAPSSYGNQAQSHGGSYPGNGYGGYPPNSQQQRPAPAGRGVDVPPPEYQQSTFRDIADDDGELPF